MIRTATGMPVLDAHADFLRARRAAVVARAVRRLMRTRRRPSTPKTLADGHGLAWRAPRLEVLPLGSIVGTLEPTTAFDAGFRPTSSLIRTRWERIALAHRRGIPLPPITVTAGRDGYYVVDGRHRVSVARALGHRDIDAWVTSVTPAR
jgi:hypothetical protein